MVNQARKQCGEKPVRNNVFIERILKWFIEFGHLNRGDMLTSEQHRCHNEKKKFQRRV
ncbi:chromosome partitioning protein ParA [Klebsiella pneumoniae]|nr:chromosome partitioning protein ParA [Klebsiella pneumoniae]